MSWDGGWCRLPRCAVLAGGWQRKKERQLSTSRAQSEQTEGSRRWGGRRGGRAGGQELRRFEGAVSSSKGESNIALARPSVNNLRLTDHGPRPLLHEMI
jgi:hypothetical protein